MNTPRLTEERLRTWAISQDDRERMCLGILALDARFSNVKPRRPKGGPDGGRDIEAVFDNRQTVWGAVGFRANANDSDEDKKWVEAKFMRDVQAATNANPALWGFVFFTNVDLTPSEVSHLEQYALSKGLSFVELFYRERLRIALDGPRGLSLRYQHLSIPLSEAEQAAFFAEFGAQIEGLLHKGFGGIDEKLRRLEFLHDCAKPLLSASVILTLKHECTPEQLGHFRFVVEILKLYEPEPHPTLWIAGRDACAAFHGGGEAITLIRTRSLMWSRNPDEKIQNTVFTHPICSTRQLEAGGHLYTRGPYKTLGDLEQTNPSIFVTEPLCDLIAGMYVIANDYVIARAESEDLLKLKPSSLVEWPEPLSDEENKVPWISLWFKEVKCPEWVNPEFPRTGWALTFSRYTPNKMPAGAE